MSDKKILLEGATDQKQEKPLQGRVLSTVLALCVCLLLAVFVWVFAMNAQESRSVSLIAPVHANVQYEISVPKIEIEGTVMTLKQIDAIMVDVPEGLEEGRYSLSAQHLILPEGVSLTGSWSAVLTVTKK